MITPEQAQELLDGDFETETHPEWVGVVQADFDSFSGAYIRATPGHEALYEAASDLAHTVANMHYEYAVQVIEGGHTWYINNHKTLTSASWGAVWLPTFDSADDLRRQCVTELCLQERCAETFVVRKLTTELEVIDPEVVE